MSASSDEELLTASLPLLSEEDKRKHRKATEHFYKKEYDAASEILDDILSERPLDYRLNHNQLVTRFYQNQLREVDAFKEKLLLILQQANINLKSIEVKRLLEPVVLYNLAVFYFQDRQPWNALELASTLSKHPSLLSFKCKLEKRTRLLLVEIYITLQKYELALDVINGAKENDIDAAGESSYSSRIEEQPQYFIQSEHDQLYEEASGIKLQEYKTICLLCSHSLVDAKKEYKVLNGLSTTAIFNNQRNNAQFLKAYYNYLRGKIRKGLTVISAIPNDNNSFFEMGDNMRMIINNNIGCCHFSLGKPTIAAWYFQKASQETNKAEYKDRSVLPIHCLSFNKKYEIMYNFGVSLLHAKQSLEAFNVLTRCQIPFSSNPRLWLRIAECCVQLYKPSNEDDFSWTEEKRNILRGVENVPSLLKLQCLSCEVIDRENPKPTLFYALHCIETAISLMNAESVLRLNKLDVNPSNPITCPVEISTLRANILCTGAFITLTLGNYRSTILLCQELMRIQGVPDVFSYLGKLYLNEALFMQGGFTLGLEAFKDNFNYSFTLNPNQQTKVNEKRECEGEQVNGDSSSSTSKTSPNKASTGFKVASEWAPRDNLSARATVVYNHAVALAALNHIQEATNVIDEWNSTVSLSGSLPAADFIILQIYLNMKLGNVEKSNRLLRQHYHPLQQSGSQAAVHPGE